MHVKRIPLVILSFLSLISSPSFSKETPSPILIKTHSISAGLGGASYPSGISYERMVSNKFSVEAGFGYIAVGCGFKYYLTNILKSKFNAYTGLTYMLTFTDYPIFYFPLGVTYSTESNVYFMFDASVIYSDYVHPNPNPYFTLKAGYRFGKVIKKAEKSEPNKRKNIICGSLAGSTPAFGAVYERLINSNLGIEAGLGFYSAGVGAKFYFPQIVKNRLNYHVGISHYSIRENVYLQILPARAGIWKTYFPLGVNYMFSNGIRWSADVGPKMDWFNTVGSEFLWTPNFNVRLGYSF